MCGILTVFSKQRPLDVNACLRALSLLSWRGPDMNFHHVFDQRLFLGQTILSITGDLSDGNGEHQVSDSKRHHLLFNGEIYNYRELAQAYLAGHSGVRGSGATDSSVLVNLHDEMAGQDIPRKLDGMYAYVVYDHKERTLSMARDVQGEKSLYYYEDDARMIISSEISVIRALVPGVALNVQSLRDYFRTRHFMRVRDTAYRGVHHLEAGQLKVFDLGTHRWSVKEAIRLKDWIDPERYRANLKRDCASLAEELDAILARCVGEMAPNGRKYAVVVSGGVDSSLLAHYYVKNHSPDMLVAVNHVGKDRISNDLSGFEQRLGRKIETIRITPAGYAGEIGRCVDVCGGPIYSHSFIAESIQCQHVMKAGLRVLIGGEGGDEYFGGYEAYCGVPVADHAFSPSPYTTCRRPDLEFADDDCGPYESELAGMWQESLQAYAFVEDRVERQKLAMMYCDAAYQLAAVGLRGTDLMSMMHSVETRCVFVRKDVVSFALNLPCHAKVDDRDGIEPLRRTKLILKELFLRFYPANLLAPKQGFAGFPNESQKYLGPVSAFLAIEKLGIKSDLLDLGMRNRDTTWKMLNIEYFLRRKDGR